ncbi:WYL domain-containing protein [Clostridium folliculivorans]|uniref:WYL domain-containing protein n=1 Tax=Clostridium folliculivorans TaxID=2886038 RepID=A0A9W5Y0C6_9CLOT|nr:WYL domain-containing protein [Clostridium folliculivorans]GKU24351.1 WYL domain-containing protein [Clostridium folliculivorans]
MTAYSDRYSKARLLFETYRLIKSGQATTRKEIAQIIGKDAKTITNYIHELNSEFGAYIEVGKNKSYEIKEEGLMGLLKSNNPLTADDATIILYALVNSQDFIETKLNIVKNTLLDILPEKEAKKLKEMFYFEKSNDLKDRITEGNIITLRKAIAEEKKVTFFYSSASGKHKMHKVIPYSFACDNGKFYLISMPEDKEMLVHYRVDRMSTLNILDEVGKKLEKFNINDYMSKTWYMYGGDETKVVVKFSKASKTVVTERNMTVGRILEENEEYFIYEFTCNGVSGIKLWLMGFGADAEVLEPYELREEIRETVENMMKIYSE